MPGSDSALVVPPALATLGRHEALSRLGTRRQFGEIAHGRPAASRRSPDCIGEFPWFVFGYQFSVISFAVQPSWLPGQARRLHHKLFIILERN